MLKFLNGNLISSYIHPGNGLKIMAWLKNRQTAGLKMKNEGQSTHQKVITAAEYRRRFCKLNPKTPYGKAGTGKYSDNPFQVTTWRQPDKDRFRSEWEREFALWITAQGWPWKYEAVRLRLADRTTYLPDFWVPWPGQKIEVYEIKGRKWPAAMVKFKVAKEQFPEFKFYLVTKNKIGGWVIS